MRASLPGSVVWGNDNAAGDATRKKSLAQSWDFYVSTISEGIKIK